MDKISIVVAVYNAEKTINKCVDSLINQTYENTEIILINDFSKDNSLEICKEYSHKYSNIVTVDNESNFGVSATRNIGIDVATGKYICFVDSDDYVEPDYLEKLHFYFEKYNTVPICGFVFYDEYNHCLPVNYQWSGGNELVSLGEAFRLKSELYLAALWNKLFDCGFIKEKGIKFDESLSMGEDLRFTVQYFQEANTEFVFVTTEKLYHYTRLTATTLMASFASNGIDNSLKNAELIRELAIKYNSESDKEYEAEVVGIKNNFKYIIIRDKNLNGKEKRKRIGDFDPNYSYMNYLRDILKLFKEGITKLRKV